MRYPLVETPDRGAVRGTDACGFADLQQLAALPAVLYFTAMGISLAVIDLDVGRLPNAIVYPSYPVVASLLAIAALAQHDASPLLRAGVGAAALFLVYFALAYLYPAGMGFGDVKLAGIVGGLLGFMSYPVLAVGAFAAFFIGSVVGIGRIVGWSANSRSSMRVRAVHDRRSLAVALCGFGRHQVLLELRVGRLTARHLSEQLRARA